MAAIVQSCRSCGAGNDRPEPRQRYSLFGLQAFKLHIAAHQKRVNCQVVQRTPGVRSERMHGIARQRCAPCERFPLSHPPASTRLLTWLSTCSWPVTAVAPSHRAGNLRPGLGQHCSLHCGLQALLLQRQGCQLVSHSIRVLQGHNQCTISMLALPGSAEGHESAVLNHEGHCTRPTCKVLTCASILKGELPGQSLLPKHLCDAGAL